MTTDARVYHPLHIALAAALTAALALASPGAAALAFGQVSAGGTRACGVTTAGAAYCCGEGRAGQLGDGTITDCPRPTAVAGGLLFRQVSGGKLHTCGVTTVGVAYCWGGNDYGELGIGTSGGPARCRGIFCSTMPVALASRLRFRQVSAGGEGTCGITTAGAAYCWGQNAFGQLGIGTATGPAVCGRVACSARPVTVLGRLAF